MRIVKPSAKLEWATPDPALTIERIARTCYQSEGAIGPGSAAALIKKLLMSKPVPHLAMLDHATASFQVVCDRGVSHEIVRHRMAAYAQESTRYCKYSSPKFGSEITVVLPPGLEPCFGPHSVVNSAAPGSHTLNACPHADTHDTACEKCMKYDAWLSSMLTAEQVYLELLDRGVSPQIARSVLPTCLKTEIVWTASFSEWLKIILPQRSQAPAHPQMVEIVGGFIKPALAQLCPEVFGLDITFQSPLVITLTEEHFEKVGS